MVEHEANESPKFTLSFSVLGYEEERLKEKASSKLAIGFVI